MQLLVIINKVVIKINVDANVKNKLIKKYVIKDLFGILVFVSVNVIIRVILASIWTLKILNAEKKKVDNLVEECTETIKEVKLVEITLKNENSYHKYSSCKVYIVFMMVIFFQFLLELLFILFIIIGL